MPSMSSLQSCNWTFDRRFKLISGVLTPYNVTGRNDLTPEFKPGTVVYTTKGKGYKYVQVLDAVASVAGQLAYWADDNLPAAWAAATAYTVGTLVRGAGQQGNNHRVYKCVRGGTSHTSEPTWPTVMRGTVEEASATKPVWKWVGYYGLNKVTADYSENLGDTLNPVAGIFTCVVTRNYYTFIQVSGICTIDATGGTFGAGEAAIGKAADCGATANIEGINAATAPTNKLIGFCGAAEAANVALCILRLRPGGRRAMIGPENIRSRNDLTPVFQPGGLYIDSLGRTYRYVYVDDAVAPIAGNVAFWSDGNTAATGLYRCTADYSEVLGDTINVVAGIWTYAATCGYYTFIQVGGLASVHTDGADAIAAGSSLKAAAVDNGAASDGVSLDNLVGTASTNNTVGYAVEAEDATAAETVLCILALDA